MRTRERVLFILAGVVGPLACFEFAHLNPDEFKPDWQAGGIQPYATLLFNIRVNLCFYLLMLWAMIALCLMLSDRERFEKMAIARMGIYTGVVVSTQYVVALALSDYLIGLLFVAPVGLVVLVVSLAPPVLRAVLLLGLLAWVIVSPEVLLFILVTGPVWSLTAYFLMAKQMWAVGRVTHPVGVASWAALYGVSWFVAVKRAKEIYKTLPTVPPDCYVVTAATRGRFGTGQLQTFREAEYALAAHAPRAHGALRAVYDRVGPYAAACLVRPWLADCAHLTLKPIEWGLRSAGFLDTDAPTPIARRSLAAARRRTLSKSRIRAPQRP